MHDFGEIVYLELQKTGSSFVCDFLRFACVHPELRHQKHMHIEGDTQHAATYFITIRRPTMLYSSLYRFGLDGRGGIFKNIAKANQLSVYASFESFSEFLLDPRNGPVLHPCYSQEIASEIGLTSFRYLLLNLRSPFNKLRLCAEQKRPVSDLMRYSIISYVLKNESLNDELLKLSTELLPEHFNPDRAREFLINASRRNQSTTSAEQVLVNSAIQRAIDAKESLLMAHYR